MKADEIGRVNIVSSNNSVKSNLHRHDLGHGPRESCMTGQSPAEDIKVPFCMVSRVSKSIESSLVILIPLCLS